MRIGTAGWTIPREFADQSSGEGTHLQRYARKFTCAEINSSFHRRHRESTWARWAESVPKSFLFSVKAPKTFTHVNGLKVDREELGRFLGEAGALGEKLGPLLFQLPPKLAFGPSVAKRSLAILRESFDGEIAWESRHASWFGKEAEAMLTEFRIARVAADPAVVPEAAVPGGSTELVYYRLHGSPRKYYSSYEDAYLRRLAADLRALKTQQRWCIFDNTASGAAFGNALQLSSSLAGGE